MPAISAAPVAESATGCLDDLDAFALVGGTLSPDRLPEVLAHVESCGDCHELIEGLCVDTPNADRGRSGDAYLGIEVACGAYRIGALLAAGGMGRVYRATDLVLDRDVAIKVPRSQARWLVRRFEREVAITARLGHPGVVPLHGAGQLTDGTPFYVMQLFDGVSLEVALARAANREQRLALLDHLVSVATTMAFVHDRRIAHRDLKPHNVLVGRFGETMILDWGLAKDLATPAPVAPGAISPPARPPTLDVAPATAPPNGGAVPSTNSIAQLLAGRTTRPGDVLGTPAFMSPEQARGEEVDQRADVYALGAMLEQLLVGRLPRKAADAALLQAPAELVAICRRAMAPDRQARHADAGELARELRATRRARTAPTDVATASAPRRWLLAVAAIAGAAVAIAISQLAGWG